MRTISIAAQWSLQWSCAIDVATCHIRWATSRQTWTLRHCGELGKPHSVCYAFARSQLGMTLVTVDLQLPSLKWPSPAILGSMCAQNLGLMRIDLSQRQYLLTPFGVQLLSFVCLAAIWQIAKISWASPHGRQAVQHLQTVLTS